MTSFSTFLLSYKFVSLKPIFYCDAKLLASGNFALPNARDSTFALPNAKNTNMLVSLALGDANFLRWPCTFFFALLATPTPDASQWNIGGVGCSGVGLVYFMYISCIFHVYFMYISCCLCIIFSAFSRRKGRFQWNMDFKPIFHCNTTLLMVGDHVGQYPNMRILHWVYQHVGIQKALRSQLQP